MSASQRGRTAERPSSRAGGSAIQASIQAPVPASRPESSLGNHLDIAGVTEINVKDINSVLSPELEAESDAVQECLSAGEELARLGCWEDAYHRLRNAVELMHGRAHPAHAELTKLRREHEMVREQARRDFLTASYNRRYLDDRLETLLEDPAVTRLGMALAMVDIDHFKKVNDRYGHPFGDRVLQRVVSELDAVLDAEVSEGAFCARYGGEEFALVLPGYDQAQAIAVCERARLRIDRHQWPELAPELRVTVSIGVAHTVAAPPDVEQLLVGADVLLYAAKGSGRNAVAYRTDAGAVALAGPAGARRDIPQPATVD
ncbi:MAG TPA: GGDEF domain-containing protein [Pseudonocardia sp.]|jgi:diguanylate cyclase (GGDEF)-like protein